MSLNGHPTTVYVSWARWASARSVSASVPLQQALWQVSRVRPVFRSSPAAGWVGVTAVAATPLGWALGAAAADGVLAYGVSRWIRGGAMSEGRKQELLLVYQERLAEMEAKERMGAVTLLDKSGCISSLREVIEKDVLSADKALRLSEAESWRCLRLIDWSMGSCWSSPRRVQSSAKRR